MKTIAAWIDSGAPSQVQAVSLKSGQTLSITAKDREWWSFQTPTPPAVPTVKDLHRVRSPIDAFLLAKLERHAISFSQETTPAVLVRRLYLDMIGLPPSYEDVERYFQDESLDRYERLVDRLLASPHYGERWGRHWLDAAGYVDVVGHDDLITSTWLQKGIWRYRDYVIRSYNLDKPFDQFLLEQIAGDELIEWREADRFTPEIREHLVATGFLRLARDQTFERVSDKAVHRYNTLVEMTAIFCTNILGLTVQCAQCHSHKYEPISQLDYYRLQAFFTPAYNPQKWRHSWGDKVEREIPLEDPETGRFLRVISEKEYQKVKLANAENDVKIAAYEETLDTIRVAARRKVLARKIVVVPEALRSAVQAAVEIPERERSDRQSQYIKQFGDLIEVTDEEVSLELETVESKRVADLEDQIRNLGKQKNHPKLIQALWDVGPPYPQYILERGDYERPGVEVQPAIFSVLDDPDDPWSIPAPGPNAVTSGYRTALARWLVRADNPLTPRVFVNRVWQRYFDRGIVETTDNVGRSGALPSHPELLDWLATEFVRGEWRLKPLHKRIVTATVYRQATDRRGIAEAADPHKMDPENRLLWKMPLRRLDSEVIRDSILAISGKLEPTMGGPPVIPFANPDGATLSFQNHSLVHPVDEFRRAIYIVNRRNYHLNTLKVFDQPVLATNCTQRKKSAIVLQSLTLLNDQFVQQQALHFANRVVQRGGDSQLRRIQLAFRWAFGRDADASELDASRKLLQQQGVLYQPTEEENKALQAGNHALVDLCHMLFNANEFLYIR